MNILINHKSPLVKQNPKGDIVDFRDLVKTAGYRLTVSSTNGWPDIRLHDDPVDFIAAPGPGIRIACISRNSLPINDPDRSQIILDKLAYMFHDWMARDVVAAEHRRVQKAIKALEAPCGSGQRIQSKPLKPG